MLMIMRKMERSLCISPICALIGLHYCLLVILATNSVQAIELISVESKRPFIDFELKKFNQIQASQKRLFGDVKHLSIAAAHLQDSFPIRDIPLEARCRAYSLLFKTLKEDPKYTGNGIKLTKIQSLALFSTDKKLLGLNLSSNNEKYFSDAAEGLFKYTQSVSNFGETQSDLVKCMKLYDYDHHLVEELIEEIELYLKFVLTSSKLNSNKHVTSDDSSGASTPADCDEIGIHQDFLENFNLSKTNEAGIVEVSHKDNSSIVESEIQLSPMEELIESHEPIGIWIYQLNNGPVKKLPVDHNEQFKLLKFVKVRSCMKSPISVQLAFDFQYHWASLYKLKKQDGAISNNKTLIGFLGDKQNVALARKIIESLKSYMKHSEMIVNLSKRNFKFASLNDYCDKLNEARSQLGQIDQKLIDIRQLISIYDIWHSTHTNTCPQLEH